MSDTGNDRIAGIPAWKNVSVWGAAFVLFNLALIASAIVVDVATYNALTREDRWIENATALLFFLTALLLLATALRGGGGGGGGDNCMALWSRSAHVFIRGRRGNQLGATFVRIRNARFSRFYQCSKRNQYP